MKWLKFVIFMTIFCFVCGEESTGDNIAEESAREMRELDREGWRMVETFPEGYSGWIPHGQMPQQTEQQFPKRRRLRKRKRRPPIIDSFTEEDTIADRVPPLRRKTRPQQLEEFQEPWEEMTEESVLKPNIRRRITPVYQPPEEILINEPESNVNPLAISVQVEDEVVNQKDSLPIFYGKNGNENENPNLPTTTVPDLKTLLKQHGGDLSLSELLQQKNLSLAELLMGNQKAISALTEKSNLSKSSNDNEPLDFEADIHKYKRLPPSIGLKKDINTYLEQRHESTESLTSKETLEAQRKRLALLQHKDNKLFSSVTKLDVITEPTTERRIFVPSHPKYYTSLDFKPKFNLYNEPSADPPIQNEEITTVTTITTPHIAQTTKKMRLLPNLQGLPITNARINKKTKSNGKEEEKERENYPEINLPEPIKIDISEVNGFKSRLYGIDKNETKQESKNMNEPLKISIDLGDLIEETTQTAELQNYTHQKTISTEANNEVTTKNPPTEKLAHVTAKEEIMEILKDPASRERLSRILENRNMTLQELVDQRERGSSQLHLADIFHNKTREPEPKDEPLVGRVNLKYFNSPEIFGRQRKSQLFDNEPIKYSTEPITRSSETVTVTSTSSPKEHYAVTSFPAFKIGVNGNDKDTNQPFLWKTLYPDLFTNNYESNYKKTEDLTDPSQYLQDSEEDFQRLNDVDNIISLSSRERLNSVEENRFEDEVLINIPSGVKSAMFVSLAIVGLSIVVFLTILLIFKWTQRQKTRLNYCNSLSSRIRAPIIIQKRPANTIKSFVCETLGRKRNHYYKSNVQSMADEMWDDCRDRKPSF